MSALPRDRIRASNLDNHLVPFDYGAGSTGFGLGGVGVTPGADARGSHDCRSFVVAEGDAKPDALPNGVVRAGEPPAAVAGAVPPALELAVEPVHVGLTVNWLPVTTVTWAPFATRFGLEPRITAPFIDRATPSADASIPGARDP